MMEMEYLFQIGWPKLDHHLIAKHHSNRSEEKGQNEWRFELIFKFLNKLKLIIY
jgi:hypothetical protein